MTKIIENQKKDITLHPNINPNLLIKFYEKTTTFCCGSNLIDAI